MAEIMSQDRVQRVCGRKVDDEVVSQQQQQQQSVGQSNDGGQSNSCRTSPPRDENRTCASKEQHARATRHPSDASPASYPSDPVVVVSGARVVGLRRRVGVVRHPWIW